MDRKMKNAYHIEAFTTHSSIPYWCASGFRFAIVVQHPTSLVIETLADRFAAEDKDTGIARTTGGGTASQSNGSSSNS